MSRVRAVDAPDGRHDGDLPHADGLAGLQESVGYVLKQASSTLRTALDSALHPLELTVAQYACLELLGRQPGLSNAELARGAFVTRQSMNLVLRGLQDRGLVTRPPAPAHGRAIPTELSPRGREVLHAASAAVGAVEQHMLSPLPPARQRRLRADLAACAAALATPSQDQPTSASRPSSPSQ
jgi:DNA-binding MarR family transcriptional regulator